MPEYYNESCLLNWLMASFFNLLQAGSRRQSSGSDQGAELEPRSRPASGRRSRAGEAANWDGAVEEMEERGRFTPGYAVRRQSDDASLNSFLSASAVRAFSGRSATTAERDRDRRSGPSGARTPHSAASAAAGAHAAREDVRSEHRDGSRRDNRREGDRAPSHHREDAADSDGSSDGFPRRPAAGRAVLDAGWRGTQAPALHDEDADDSSDALSLRPRSRPESALSRGGRPAPRMLPPQLAALPSPVHPSAAERQPPGRTRSASWVPDRLSPRRRVATSFFIPAGEANLSPRRPGSSAGSSPRLPFGSRASLSPSPPRSRVGGGHASGRSSPDPVQPPVRSGGGGSGAAGDRLSTAGGVPLRDLVTAIVEGLQASGVHVEGLEPPHAASQHTPQPEQYQSKHREPGMLHS